MAADLTHPSLGKVLNTLYATLARYVVLQSPNFDLFIYPFIALKKKQAHKMQLIKCPSIVRHYY